MDETKRHTIPGIETIEDFDRLWNEAISRPGASLMEEIDREEFEKECWTFMDELLKRAGLDE